LKVGGRAITCQVELQVPAVQQSFLDEPAVEKHVAYKIEVCIQHIANVLIDAAFVAPLDDFRREVRRKRPPGRCPVDTILDQHVGRNSQAQLDERCESSGIVRSGYGPASNDG